MDQLLTKYISDVKEKTNYLSKANTSKSQYFDDFKAVYDTYKTNFSKHTNQWLRDKMLLNDHAFDEKQFIQYACEATIIKYFADRYKSNLEIEKQLNPPSKKDVDLVFNVYEFAFNIEIKCSDFKQKELVDQKNTLKIQTIGRHPDLQGVMDDLSPVVKEIAKKMNLEGVDVSKNMDNNLKDFLKSANDKFNPNATDKELNVLSVSCNDAEDMQLWYYYMYKDQGLFTDSSFCPHSSYENVDVVLLNNLYFKHNKWFDKKLKNSWSLEESFNLIFLNPYAKKKKESAIQKFLTICPNYNAQFRPYDIPGHAEEEVKDSRRIAHFIKAHLEEKEQIYLFEQP